MRYVKVGIKEQKSGVEVVTGPTLSNESLAVVQSFLEGCCNKHLSTAGSLQPVNAQVFLPISADV